MSIDRLDPVRAVADLLWKESAALREYCRGEEYAFAHTDPKAREMMAYVRGIKDAMDALMIKALEEEQHGKKTNP